MAGDKRSYVGGNFMFQLDGIKCGFIKSIGGGAISADVINEPVGPDYFTKKHIGGPRFADFEMEIGFSMSRAVYEWIESSWKQNHQRKNGAIISADSNMNARSEREFTGALVTETGVPKCDGSGKEPAYMTLKFAPEHARFKQAQGKISGDIGGKQKAWLPSNFRLDMAGLDCSRVSKIDAFSIKQTVTENEIGDGGADDHGEKVPGKLEFPALKITFSEATSQSWVEWFEDFVIKGNNHETNENSGSLSFLSSNREKELLRINLFNLGIYKLSPDKSEANEDKIKRVTAELYCERMEFSYLDFVAG